MGLTLAWSRAGHFPRTPKTRRFRGLLRCHLRRGHFLKGRTPDFREPGTSGVVLASAHARGAQCSLGHADVSGCSVMGSWDVTKDDAPEAVCQEQGSGPSPPGRPHKRWARRKKPQVKGVPGKQRDPSLRPAPKGSRLRGFPVWLSVFSREHSPVQQGKTSWGRVSRPFLRLKQLLDD
ncbi:uncharacterized protein LOC144579619 isoform X2 [Callithrix jacchus]